MQDRNRKPNQVVVLSSNKKDSLNCDKVVFSRQGDDFTVVDFFIFDDFDRKKKAIDLTDVEDVYLIAESFDGHMVDCRGKVIDNRQGVVQVRLTRELTSRLGEYSNSYLEIEYQNGHKLTTQSFKIDIKKGYDITKAQNVYYEAKLQELVDRYDRAMHPVLPATYISVDPQPFEKNKKYTTDLQYILNGRAKDVKIDDVIIFKDNSIGVVETVEKVEETCLVYISNKFGGV